MVGSRKGVIPMDLNRITANRETKRRITMNQIFTKKPLSVLMALVMLLTMLSLSVTAAASEVDTSDATSFVFADSGVTVTQGA